MVHLAAIVYMAHLAGLAAHLQVSPPNAQKCRMQFILNQSDTEVSPENLLKKLRRGVAPSRQPTP